MTELEYRNHPALSQSDLKKIDTSPVKFAKGLLHTKQTKEMLLGSYLHDLILLKDVSAYKEQLFTNEVKSNWYGKYKIWVEEQKLILPKSKKPKLSEIEHFPKTNFYKNIYKEKYGEKEILDDSDLETINNMKQALIREGLLDKFELGIVELPIFFDFYDTEMKGKPDYYNDKVLRDLKTISDISLVNKSMESYLIQAGLYHYGLMQQDGINRKVEYIFVEKKEPFETAVIELPPVALEIGCLQAKEILDKWKDYQLGQFTNDKTYEPPNYLKYKYGV